ncbi:two-component system sensor histidine kinase DctS [Chitinivorax tropicus]|uniref:histidine kinase n=1 Tax=Chitinivorax tropicus TaxID=714531 RepID=A0A840MJC7_9PROT|nr:ATP-binding protein [Chitinivorax tropicus]MBB5016782.1 two-component system sensor histidine kinase DctS [Chitinivorax tropicus]
MNLIFPPRVPTATHRSLWLLPRIALALFIAAVAGLLWYSHHDERSEQRQVLINDVLWVEQNLRFQFEQTEERLRSLLQSQRSGQLDLDTFNARVQFIQSSNPGVTRVQIRSPDDAAIYDSTPIGRQYLPEIQAASAFATRSGNSSYSDIFKQGQDAIIALVVPEGEHVAVALMSLNKMVAQQVPWWFAVKYRLVIHDSNGQIIASKSQVETGDETLSYQVPLEPPGKDLLLKVTAYRQPSSIVRNLLVTAVVSLALAVVYSWWRLRRHVQGRLQAEAALRAEHAFRQAMEDSLSVGMRARDLEGRIIYVNPAFCKMVGFSKEELIGATPPYPYWVPEAMEHHLQQNQAVLSGNAPMAGFESRIRHRNGHYVDTMVYTTPLIDADGQKRGWMSSVLDITERKRIEEHTRQQEEVLRQTAKLVSMGEMASTLAHELNQPLMAMSGYANAAQQLAKQPDRQLLLGSTLDKIAEQAQRAAQIVRRIREFVRRSTPHRETCNLNSVIDDAMGLVEPDARQKRVKLVVNQQPLPDIQADKVLIEQVLLNLLRNAIDACASQPASGGEITIMACEYRGMLQVSVRDTGGGIPDQVAQHLFEAFFTTKNMGMGMGLSICRSIIENHQGKLWFETEPGVGTCFHFTLPL